MTTCRLALAVPLLLTVASGSGCGDPPTLPEHGHISVSVVDASGPPVADVEVWIAPVGLVERTDAQGHSLFEVLPGKYFVEASVCCQGPGFIEHRVPVTVTEGRTETVELRSCLICQ